MPASARGFSRCSTSSPRESTGSTTFVARAILLDEPPSIDAREITDKGSLNQKMMLQNRSALVDELYASPLAPSRTS